MMTRELNDNELIDAEISVTENMKSLRSGLSIMRKA